MSRSVYSLVLTDQVIREIDKVAYAQNTSRSNLINQILADFVSFTTPEKRMKDVFEELVRTIGFQGSFQVQEQPSDAMLSLRSALNFRYNPTIRYSVELYRDGEIGVGELRVASRTQSRRLLLCLEDFFRKFSVLEIQCREQLAGLPPPEFQIAEGRFYRKLLLPGNREGISEHQLGTAIALYIQTINQMAEIYFEDISNPEEALCQMKLFYQNYFQNTEIPL